MSARREQALSVEADSLGVALEHAQRDAEEVLDERRYGTRPPYDGPHEVSDVRLELKGWSSEWCPWEYGRDKWRSAFQFTLSWEEESKR